MNNHQNAIFHQIANFLKTPLALLGVDLKNFQFNKICHFANHPYLCKGLYSNNFAGDITEVDEKDIPSFDFLFAGFPRQSFFKGNYYKDSEVK
uniref:DNA cytosine methyltransferase n=1 Tax=Candidatus Thiodubiliella endoseptemdiera TaxID=2738886 RepID=UPI0034E04318